MLIIRNTTRGLFSLHINCKPIVAPNINITQFRTKVEYYSPHKITEILRKNETRLAKELLPKSIKSLECNQLASNSPIEDRLRVSSIVLPDSIEPSLILGVFDGHGGGTTADIISRRLFNYIALSLHPEPKSLKISNYGELNNLVVDHHNSPLIIEESFLQNAELDLLHQFKDQLINNNNIAANLKTSFMRCDDDLSMEIQRNLTQTISHQKVLHIYLSAAVSGCCALVMLIHRGIGYVASSGDCRAILGIHKKTNSSRIPHKDDTLLKDTFSAVDLNDEHNCDNINEIRRLDASHPKSEQNTMIKHNRLLGHLMPFRAFGDYNYKWPTEVIKQCGITKVFGPNVIPSDYKTPPYLIAEPDVKEIDFREIRDEQAEKYLVIATDGLWELFESSRDVMETIVDHSKNASQPEMLDDYDENCATHILRCALRSGSQQDFGKDADELKRLYHIRLESTLTLPQAVVRNFRDDISIINLRLQ